jgi:nucleotide-binding universal stress UspA family protein
MTRHLGHLKSALAEDGIKVSSEIITGVQSKLDVPNTILDYTRKVKGDLIFIMTQKEQTPVQYFLGSVAQQLINQDSVPVLSITP